MDRAKLGTGLLSGRYSKPRSDFYQRDPSGNGDDEKAGDDMKWQVGIPPRTFKALIGRGHPEFSTRNQQDASEFVLYLINLMEVTSPFFFRGLRIRRYEYFLATCGKMLMSQVRCRLPLSKNLDIYLV